MGGFLWIFFLFLSFWPWENDSGQVQKSSLEFPQDPASATTLRVALFYEKTEVQIGIAGPYELKSLPQEESLAEGSSLNLALVRPDPSGIRVGPVLYRVSGLQIEGPAKEVRVEKRKYRNAIQVLKNPAGSLTVVNKIDVEDYLQGVVPSETYPGWPAEALKAQAVVSRTHAIFKNIKNKDLPFTLTSDVTTQVYGGKTAEAPAANRAVKETRGEILTYRGKIFPAFFSSTCGGRTTRADFQWKIEPHPSLKGVECTFCQGSKYFNWKADLSGAEIEGRLRKKGFAVTGIQKIVPEEIDRSGRPRFFLIQHAGGSLQIPANSFRMAVGPDLMRSTKVKIDPSGDPFHFQGRGWGHGVGLCQFGAKRLAELGYGYREILRYYYPESEIQNLEEKIGEGAPLPPASREENILKGWFKKAKTYLEEL